MTLTSLKAIQLEKQLAGQPLEVKFCKKCVISNQRPRIVFDEEGVCSACRYAERKQNDIIWPHREVELVKMLDKYRRNDGEFDVIVPCSGGKDASYVAHQLKFKYKMNPLCITWAPFMYTDIGWRNLQSFIASGFNHIMGHANGHLHRKLTRLSMEEIGDPFVPFIYGQICFAFHIALKFDVKLVFFGENGEAEYGGDPKNNERPFMPMEDWATAYWKGTPVDDLIKYGIENKDYLSEDDYVESDLKFYRPPNMEKLKAAGIQMHWYSYYHKWNPQENYYYCTENMGFRGNPERSEGTYSKYASLDDKLDGLHYYLALIKFGLGRATSDTAHEIRCLHILREEAVALVNRYDCEFPKKHLKECLNYMDMTEEELHQAIDSFRPAHLWDKVGGQWILKHKVSL